jgi:hypothetical protein
MRRDPTTTEARANRSDRGRRALLWLSRDSDLRPQAEALIRRIFAHAYGAQVTQFMPRLMALVDERRRVEAALGLRGAAAERLFLEVYLDEPVEQVLSRMIGQPLSREQIAEVGNLASATRGGMRQLIVSLTAYLQGAGCGWAVFTAVPPVRLAFERFGIPLQALAEADKARLGHEQHLWGRYYDQSPQVVATRVTDAFAVLSAQLRLERDQRISSLLWDLAYRSGRHDSRGPARDHNSQCDMQL